MAGHPPRRLGDHRGRRLRRVRVHDDDVGAGRGVDRLQDPHRWRPPTPSRSSGSAGTAATAPASTTRSPTPARYRSTGTCAPTGEGGVGSRDCSNWTVTDTWTVPVDAVHGVYLGVIKRAGGGTVACRPVRRPHHVLGDQADILCKLSDMTWRAYNTFGTLAAPTGGKSLYGQSASGDFSQGNRAWDVDLRHSADGRRRRRRKPPIGTVSNRSTPGWSATATTSPTSPASTSTPTPAAARSQGDHLGRPRRVLVAERP